MPIITNASVIKVQCSADETKSLEVCKVIVIFAFCNRGI